MTYRQLKYDPATNDLAVTAGRLVVIDEQDSILQSIRSRLLTIRGEWRYDLTDGVPYFEEILQQSPRNLAAVEDVLREAVLETPGVAAITELTTEYEGLTNTLTVAVSVITSVDAVTAAFVKVDIGNTL